MPSGLETACQPVSARGEEAWPATIHDISRTGIALVLDRRFERGTLLSVQLENKARSFGRTIFARVVHIQLQEDKAWLHGCAFAGELDEDEFSYLHAERGRPTDPDCRAWVRFNCDVPATAWLVGPNQGESMPVRVLDVAPDRMAVLAPAAPPTGTRLRLEWSGSEGRPQRPVEVRVIQAASQGGDGWLLGCDLVAQIDAAELNALRGGATS
jgi:hypothetical protein